MVHVSVSQTASKPSPGADAYEDAIFHRAFPSELWFQAKIVFYVTFNILVVANFSGVKQCIPTVSLMQTFEKQMLNL